MERKKPLFHNAKSFAVSDLGNLPEKSVSLT
jgi:hypothetical protein